MFWMQKSWWRSLLQVTHRERVGLISLLVLLGLTAWLTKRYQRYEEKAAVAWSAVQLPPADQTKTRTLTKNRPLYSRSYTPTEKRTRYSSDQNERSKAGSIRSWQPNISAPKWPAKHKPVAIDINEADSAAWCQLPGIGPYYARKIIRFRDRLGGFISVAQVGETFGLPDSTFQRMRAYLRIDQLQPPRLDINQSDAETLARHPYISKSLARVIVAYRNQHGPFTTPESLRAVRLLVDSVYVKLAPYIIIN
jgi:DNA uptake protein ComE-like DNA-binding protein